MAAPRPSPLRRHRPRPERPHAPLQLTTRRDCAWRRPELHASGSLTRTVTSRRRCGTWRCPVRLYRGHDSLARSSSRCSPRSRSQPATSVAKTARRRPCTIAPTGRPGCWPTPTRTRSACPTRACRSSTRSSTSGPTPLPSATYAPWTDLEALLREHGLPLFSVDTHRPAGDFDVLAFNLSAELVYTNVLNCIDLAGVPVRAAERRPAAPARRGRRPLHLQPRASGRLPRLRRAGRRRGGRRRDHRGRRARGRPAGRSDRASRSCARSARMPGVYVPSLYDVALLTATARRRVTPRYADVPARVEKRTITDLADWPYPKQPARAAHRGRPRPAERRGVPGLHPRLPVLPGRHDHPAGARAPGRPGPPMVQRGPAAHRLRRGGAHLAVHRRLLAASSGVVADTVNDPMRAARSPCRLPSLRVDAFTVGIAARDPEGPPHRPHVRARGGHLAHAPGHQQADPRGRPLRAVDSAYSQGWRRMKLYFLTGLPTETDEDTLGIADARPPLRRDRPAATTRTPSVTVSRRRVRAQAVHAVPVVRPEHREELQPQDRPAARRRCGATSGVQLKWHDPKATAGRRPRQPRRPPPRRRHRGRVARTAARSRSGREHFDLDLWTEALERHGLSTRLVRPPPPHRGRGPAVGPPLRRAAQGLPLAGLARRARRGRPRGLPLDALLRLRRVHRLRHRAHRRLGRRRRPAAARAPARTSRRGGEVPVQLLHAQAVAAGRRG